MPETNFPRARNAHFVGSYTELATEVRESGLLDRRRCFYGVRIALTVAAFIGLWATAMWLGESWWQLVVAAALAVVSTQFGFLGHDGAHAQMYATRAAND